MNFSKAAVFAWGVTCMVAALALATIGTGWHELRNQRDVRAARESLRKLATLTIRNFPERNLDTPDLFWKAIGREGDPMRDPWGTAYQLSQREEAGARLYFWTSAGADALFATRDDVVVEVPYPAGPFSAPDPGAGAEGSQPESMNAK